MMQVAVEDVTGDVTLKINVNDAGSSRGCKW